ncbi:Filament-like plant protein 6 [Camellia lanceoleosa]|uniref:Filament-like plant protein 6 n=1 Tax=Camellia lanceoleosa TaxID=1840588 RepID=A0ACC0GU84_9ERIC|nr:Filament-like plant protein 6 [Camellia lanceoleosa]
MFGGFTGPHGCLPVFHMSGYIFPSAQNQIGRRTPLGCTPLRRSCACFVSPNQRLTRRPSVTPPTALFHVGFVVVSAQNQWWDEWLYSPLCWRSLAPQFSGHQFLEWKILWAIESYALYIDFQMLTNISLDHLLRLYSRRRQDTPGSISVWHLGGAAHRLVANSPSPAALAQMKLEVENLGRDYGETRVRRSLLKPPSPLPPQLSDFSLDSVPKFYKENDFLTERLLAMEEETKMLKKALC